MLFLLSFIRIINNGIFEKIQSVVFIGFAITIESKAVLTSLSFRTSFVDIYFQISNQTSMFNVNIKNRGEIGAFGTVKNRIKITFNQSNYFNCSIPITNPSSKHKWNRVNLFDFFQFIYLLAYYSQPVEMYDDEDTSGVVVYHSSVAGNVMVNKNTTRVFSILDARKIPYTVVDCSLDE